MNRLAWIIPFCLCVYPAAGQARQVYKITPTRHIEVTDLTTTPAVTFKPWDDDQISLVYTPDSHTTTVTCVQDGDFLRLLIRFSQAPTSNTYTFQLAGNWRDFIFAYQTPFESPEAFEWNGEPWLRQTYADGVVCERPRNVDGSYAVYHRTKRNNQYQTGKATHILVPKATDARGRQQWATLFIDSNTGTGTITLDSDYLRSATYPVVVNDTFGYYTASQGASTQNHNANWLLAVKDAPANSGSATEIRAWIRTDTSKAWSAGLYNSDASSLIEDTDEYSSPGGAAAAVAVFTLDVAQSVTAATDYMAAIWSESNASILYYDNLGTDVPSYYNTGTGSYVAGTMPASWTPTGPFADHSFCIWVEYTASGGSGTPQVISTTWEEMMREKQREWMANYRARGLPLYLN